MAHQRTERTSQGDQFILPGAERRTAPGLPYTAEADGQLGLAFYDPPSAAERLQLQAEAPLRPRRRQRGTAGLPLLDTAVHPDRAGAEQGTCDALRRHRVAGDAVRNPGGDGGGR